jgi:hypothetical protein
LTEESTLYYSPKAVQQVVEEGSGLHSMECFVGLAQKKKGIRFFGLVWREALFVDLSGDMF